RGALASGQLPARLFVQATALDASAPLLRGAIAEDGFFRFEALEAGRWEVRASIYRDDTRVTDSTTVELGKEGLATVALEPR
ncbi:MAG: hypothetical protein ABL998_13095, partial [Planctomycetota bacterium]